MADDIYFKVLINGNGDKYDLSEEVLSLSVDEQRGRADQLTLKVNDPHKVLNHALVEGVAVEVDLGTDKDHSIVFRGQIHKVDSEFPDAAIQNLTIYAHDASMKMGLKKCSRNWSGTLYSVVNEITGAYRKFFNTTIFIDKKIEKQVITNSNSLQFEQSDLNFLHYLAERFNCEVFIEPGDYRDNLHFDSLSKLMAADPKVTLYHGRCDIKNRLLSFKIESDIANIQIPESRLGLDINSGKWVKTKPIKEQTVLKPDDNHLEESLVEFRKQYEDKADKLKPLLSQAESIFEELRQGLGERRSMSPFLNPEETSAQSESFYNTRHYGMKASGATNGNPKLHAQLNLNVQGVGRFSGIWFVSQARHVLDEQGYRTEFQCEK